MLSARDRKSLVNRIDEEALLADVWLGLADDVAVVAVGPRVDVVTPLAVEDTTLDVAG